MVLLESTTMQPRAIPPRADDLSREVFGLLGLTLDALNFQSLLHSIDAASVRMVPFLISTPNVNFLVTSRRNSKFRESILRSDICIADGMPLIWIARFLGVPIRERITGADLFDTLKLAPNGRRRRRLQVFLFGGAEGVAERVSKSLNSSDAGMECVGSLNPGFGTIDEMSSDKIIDAINSSGADLLAVFLGAEKAQTWLLQNHSRIRIPIRAQFGAAINFEAGTIKRAPPLLRNSGLEWVWRIKEEPYLWRRYGRDGLTLLHVFLTGVLPLAAYSRLARFKRSGSNEGLRVESRVRQRSVVISLSGSATSEYIDEAVKGFREALTADKDVVIECSNLGMIDPRFVGLVLMMRKMLTSRGQSVSFIDVPASVQRAFKFNGFAFLLE